MPKIPDVSKIGPYRYATVHELGPFKPLNDPDEKRDLIGESCHNDQLIRLAPAPPARKFVVYFHEVLHAIDEMVYANLSEKQIERISPAIVAFLIDNGYLPDDS